MDGTTVVEILLGLLTAAVGFFSYHSASRAARAQSLATQADVDAEAYNRARMIYESAIDALEEHVERLRKQANLLDDEVIKLQASNAELKRQVIELQVANVRLEAELTQLRSERQ